MLPVSSARLWLQVPGWVTIAAARPPPDPGSHLSIFFPPGVCNSTDLPEVEIISLLEEQLPHYKLRADTIYGYDHDDWLHTPSFLQMSTLTSAAEQIEETAEVLPWWLPFPGKALSSALSHGRTRVRVPAAVSSSLLYVGVV